ncbi:MAG: oligosaccharide flippase family protein, partial [Myxococcales bacterium]|nr:oligosaccharide flippase family protein [Myxococcales bacterium]
MDETKKQVAAGVGRVSSARTVGGVLNVLLIVALTRLLPRDEFAVVALIYLVQETINALGPLGLPDAMSFFVPKLGQAASRALGVHVGRLLVGLALPYAAVLWFLGPSIAAWIDMPQVALPLVLLGFAVIADFPGQTLAMYLIARQEYDGAFWATLLFYVSRFASFVIPAALGAGPDIIIGAFVGVALIRGAAYLVWF